jgi:omega-amidase
MDQKKITVSLGQFDVLQGHVETNLETVSGMVKEAARRGSGLVAFPELWSTGYDLKHSSHYATAVDQGVFSKVADLAREHKIAIVGSQLSILGEGCFGNTAVYFDQFGSNLGSYSKVHLFGPMQEVEYLTAGESLTIIETGWGKMGLAICYDLRFPELFRAYALAGVHAVILVAEWPRPRLEHWRTLLRARAIENQMFIIACNRVGQTGEIEFFGHSCLIDPCGEAVIEAGEGTGLYTADLDLDQINEVRASMPVFSDRQPDAYRLLKSNPNE